MKHKIFISSVQSEFAEERQALHDYILADALLGKFFEPFLFERLPATDQGADQVYLQEVERCHIYLGILGQQYGSQDEEGVSPTEREFDHATTHHKTRLVFLSDHSTTERHQKQQAFVQKAQSVLIRKKFGSIDELKAAVYAALVRYLEEKEVIRSSPFDMTLHATADINDISSDSVQDFIRTARSKRGFPISESAPLEKVLTHLNVLHNEKLTHAAILLFGKEPQRFFINSEVRCAGFHGTIVEKPIPSYKVYKGDVFQLVDQAVDFVLSRLDYSIGTRAQSTSIPGKYEIPPAMVTEAIVNAVAHRDYTSNASIQVMVFRDRVEIWNPGQLPIGWTVEKLKQVHNSIPSNPLLAEPMYLKGYIERLGTGTSDMIKLAHQSDLKEPQFVQDDQFTTTLYRPSTDQVPTEYPASTQQVPSKYPASTQQVINLIKILTGEMSREEMQNTLELLDRENFRSSYLKPALEAKFIERTFPKSPKHPNQKYRLTKLGAKLKKELLQ